MPLVWGRYPSSQAGPFLLLLPVFSILGGWLFLQEPLSQRMSLGGVVIVFGVDLLTVQRLPVSK